MQTYSAKRVEIVIEAPLVRKLTAALTKAGVRGYTILPVLGGAGDSGVWSREGQIGTAGAMCAVICVTSPDKAERLVEAAFNVLSHQIGMLSVSDCEVLRKERF